MYELSGVTKNYRKGRATIVALAGVDLRVQDGEWLAIQGPTGQGKTTLLQILGGLDRPTSGVVDFDGRDLAALRESQVNRVRASSIGFIFQTFNLIPTLNAQENVEAALVPLGVDVSERRARAAQALSDVGLADRARHLPSELSGGQQQRVAIARALVKRPTVLLADEPTGNLDEVTRDEIIGLLERLWREHGLTLILVTHDSTVAARAQRIGLMQQGQLAIKQDTRHGAADRAAHAGGGRGGAKPRGSCCSHQTTLPAGVRRAPQRSESWLTICRPRPDSSSPAAYLILGSADEESAISLVSVRSRTRRRVTGPLV